MLGIATPHVVTQ